MSSKAENGLMEVTQKRLEEQTSNDKSLACENEELARIQRDLHETQARIVALKAAINKERNMFEERPTCGVGLTNSLEDSLPNSQDRVRELGEELLSRIRYAEGLRRHIREKSCRRGRRLTTSGYKFFHYSLHGL
jgi:hypothetical protein